jgi:hypothetical protein
MSDPVTSMETHTTTAQNAEHPVYVYGVIPAADVNDWPHVTGLHGPSHTVRTVVEGNLAALVSDLPPDHMPGRAEDLEAHRRVLAQAIERGTTIPMRFGIVMDGDDRVRERLLAGHAAELGDLMAALDGEVQMTVKAFYAGDALLRDVLAAHPDLARASAAIAPGDDPLTHQERVQVGERVAEAVEERRAEVESALLHALSPVAEDVVVEPPGSERVALSGQLLVRRDRRSELDAKVRELGAALESELAFRYVGPLPPYSFTDVSLHEDDD